MPETQESPSHMGPLPGCASLQDAISPMESGRAGLTLSRWMAGGCHPEPHSHPGQGFAPGRALSPPSSMALLGTSSTAAGGFISPGTPEWTRHPPALGWPGGTRLEHLTSAFPFCHRLLSPRLPQVSLIRTSAILTASVLVWAGIQHRLADPE